MHTHMRRTHMHTHAHNTRTHTHARMHMWKRRYDELVKRNAPGDWSFVKKQIGMFSYTGLTRAQCEHMTANWHVYLTMDGRISMAGACQLCV